MEIKELFSGAEKIIAEKTLKNRDPDLLKQYEIIRLRNWTKQTEEHQILNNFAMAAASYSAMRKNFKVLYPEEISNFDQHFSTAHFKKGTEPKFTYDDWVSITLSWGNSVLSEYGITHQDNLNSLIQKMKTSSISTNQHRPRLVYSLASGLPKVKKLILPDSESYWEKYDNLSRQYPGKAFNYAKDFSSDIIQMGTPLVCNFLKELGLLYYVKTDVHLSNFLGQMVSTCKKLSEKEQFILTWLLAKEIGIEPFYLDKILYVCGKFCKDSVSHLFQRHKTEYLATVQRLVRQIPAHLQ